MDADERSIVDQIDSIGRRIAQYRKLRGWSQRELADRVGYSLSQVEKIERGVRAVERYSTLHTFARTLNVDIAELTGDPGKVRKSREHSTIPEIRRVLTSFSIDAGPLRDADALQRDVAAAIAARQRGKYSRFGEDLPILLEELQRAVSQSESGSSARQHHNALLAELLHGGSILLRRLGYVDLSWIAIQRARTAAEQSDDELLPVANDWHLAELLMKTGNSTEALALADRAVDQLDDALTRQGPTPQVLSLIGTFHLVRSMVAAQRIQRSGVTDALRDAADAAQRNAGDRDDYQSVFGPSNVSVFEVATAVELGDGAAAVQRSTSIDVEKIHSRERQTRYLIDVARAYLQTDQPEAALHVLLEAQKKSPVYLLNHVMAREVVAQLLERERRSITPGLRTLAKHMEIS